MKGNNNNPYTHETDTRALRYLVYRFLNSDYCSLAVKRNPYGTCTMSHLFINDLFLQINYFTNKGLM